MKFYRGLLQYSVQSMEADFTTTASGNQREEIVIIFTV